MSVDSKESLPTEAKVEDEPNAPEESGGGEASKSKSNGKKTKPGRNRDIGQTLSWSS